MVKSINQLVKEVEKHKKAIAEHRDALREIYSDIESIIDTTNDGLNYLDYAIDSFSEFM